MLRWLPSLASVDTCVCVLQIMNICSILIGFIFKISKMSSNQVEIKFMIAKLYDWNKELGGNQAKRSLAESEFDFLQQEFLTKRHLVQKLQDQKEKEGLTTKNASIAYEIRQGIGQMKDLYGRLEEQLRKLRKKKKDPPQILQKKQKIVQNCQLLLKDIQQRQQFDGPVYKPQQAITLTDMKAKLLAEIDQNNQKIHGVGSDGKLSEINSQEEQAMKDFKKGDEQIDAALDDVIIGIKGVKEKVKGINARQDEIIDKTKKNEKKMDKLSKRIQQDNDKLKEIIKKFKPNRCCLWIALFLLFIGLIVVIIKCFM